MAGLGRRTHYRKHLTDSIIYDFPEPGENERIAKVVATRGSNQFDIVLSLSEDADPETTRESHLAILPTKFNKLVWVKRNDFVIVETGEEEQQAETNVDTGGIRFIISHILYKDQVKHLQSKGLWPTKDAEFSTEKIGLRSPDQDDVGQTGGDGDEKGTSAENDDGIVYDTGYEDDDYLVNTNRIAALKVDDSSDSDSEAEE